MGIEWYDMIARRNGGYKNRAVCTVVGRSAEDVFEERLIQMLPKFHSVMDAGCGHGEFTLRMSAHTTSIKGFDNSHELITIAQNLLQDSQVEHVEFVYATTKSELPFLDGQFDLIYDRRGPTSVINHSRVLKSGGTIIGIHGNVDLVKERLVKNGFLDIEIEEYNEAITYFPTREQFVIFLSDGPGSPDYTKVEHQPELDMLFSELALQGRLVGELGIREQKYIWQARKP
ncbi:methyltransferase type 11 [Paenibacillus pectinilyticus]|uniref:Methyltransferase type 11 n=1 Tax=Paenibacillus pectinilyticus TaxID=512399 RepID=A0A1C1A1U6_9BACL|nr:class I SAM-dependent methyltransferase [Paenibacillus pectinilyticus]OCT14497.1 methyltransferase type 11 [Paenibacillus pectinilyticus]